MNPQKVRKIMAQTPLDGQYSTYFQGPGGACKAWGALDELPELREASVDSLWRILRSRSNQMLEMFRGLGLRGAEFRASLGFGV